jgi:hypothetical protein
MALTTARSVMRLSTLPAATSVVLPPESSRIASTAPRSKSSGTRSAATIASTATSRTAPSAVTAIAACWVTSSRMRTPRGEGLERGIEGIAAPSFSSKGPASTA